MVDDAAGGDAGALPDADAGALALAGGEVPDGVTDAAGVGEGVGDGELEVSAAGPTGGGAAVPGEDELDPPASALRPQTTRTRASTPPPTATARLRQYTLSGGGP